MECWDNAVKNIFPIFQYSSYDNVFVLSAVPFALCVPPGIRQRRIR